jgi:hypothetical protein
MHSNRTHAIFWAPAGHPFPPNYEYLINGFLGNVAAASGASDNVYSVATELGDSGGSLQYASSFASPAIDDPTAYPVSGCVDATVPPATVCLTDAQLQAEIASVIDAQNLPTGLGDVYFIFTPPGVGSCFDVVPTNGCSFVSGGYCAYHSDFVHNGGEVIYASQPYDDVSGCQPGEYPNGTATGADPTIDALSHEHNEAITDPLGNPGAWSDAQGFEIGDKCQQTYGSALGSTDSGQYNQVINGGKYYIQFEWSNALAGCAGGESLSAQFTLNPSDPSTGESVTFDGRGSQDSHGAINSYSWQFGDGAGSSGAQTTHTYSRPGTFTVTLKVTDSNGQSATLDRKLSVGAGGRPSSSPPPAGAAGATLRGTLKVLRQPLRRVLRRGLLVRYTTTLPATARISVLASGALARRLKLPAGSAPTASDKSLALGNLQTAAQTSGRVRTVVKLDPSLASKLGRTHRLAIEVQAILTDASGHTYTVARRVTLTG